MATKKFRRHDAHKKARLSESWRKPRGRQNKLRLKKRGYGKPISAGYGSPRATRGLVKGLEPVVIATLAELAALKPKQQGAIILATLGGRKREALLTAAKERGVTILNLNPEQQLAALKARLAARKEKLQERRSKKEQKSLEAKAKKVEAEAKSALSAEEKAAAEKRVKEKVLTKKQ